MSAQNFKDFMEDQKYTEEQEQKKKQRSIDKKNVAICVLALLSVTVIGSHVWAKSNFEKTLDQKELEVEHYKKLSYDANGNKYKDIAYDENGRQFKVKYAELDRQYHQIVEYMNALGYDLSFGAYGE